MIIVHHQQHKRFGRRYNTDYRLSMENVTKDYEGSESITDIKMQNLNKSYFDYLTANSETSTYSNIKAVAYMTDTNVWSVFRDNAHAEYAIGGPPIEMLMKSYSEKYHVAYQARAKDKVGYEFTTDGGTSWKSYMDRSSEYLNTADSLYVITDKTKAQGMWLASPCAFGGAAMVDLEEEGKIWSFDWNAYAWSAESPGFRPVVCLNSDVQLQKNADGSYTIK